MMSISIVIIAIVVIDVGVIVLFSLYLLVFGNRKKKRHKSHAAPKGQPGTPETGSKAPAPTTDAKHRKAPEKETRGSGNRTKGGPGHDTKVKTPDNRPKNPSGASRDKSRVRQEESDKRGR